MRAKCNDDLSTVNFSTIGLDVHKNRLVACAVHVQHDAKGREVHEKEYFESTGTYSGRQRLTEWCSSQNADLILMESTGIFWKASFRDLEKADLHPVLINLRIFNRGSDKRKTDKRKLFKTPISERWGKHICLNPENRGIYTQSDSPKKSSRNIWSLAVVSVDQRY